MAKGIIGTKLGMTQLFDQESGRVTPVTVIEAGPCPVVAVRTPETDGYTAVQLAFGAGQGEAARRGPRPAISRPPGSAPHRTLVEFRDADGLERRRHGHRRVVRAGRRGQGRRASPRGKGFAGTIKRHRFSRGPASHGSHNVRAPGSIGASATPSHVYKGTQDGRPDGLAARHPARPARGRDRRRAQPPARRGRRPRRDRRRRRRSGATADGRPHRTRDHRRREGQARRGRVRPRAKRRARARGREGRAGRPPPGHVVDQDPRPGRRRPRQAVAPEGHRPRPRRHHPRAATGPAAASSSARTRAATPARSTARRG